MEKVARIQKRFCKWSWDRCSAYTCNKCTGGYDVVTNACEMAMVSIAEALLMP
jgi:hypothetical protein